VGNRTQTRLAIQFHENRQHSTVYRKIAEVVTDDTLEN
jgi:hypothetical protein